jgi:hypothetical protein
MQMFFSGSWDGPNFLGLDPLDAASRWFSSAERALAEVHGVTDPKFFGRHKGCQIQLVPLRAAWGQELYQRPNLLTQKWLSLRRLSLQFLKATKPEAQAQLVRIASPLSTLFAEAGQEQLRGLTLANLFTQLADSATRGPLVDAVQAEVVSRVKQEAAEGRQKWKSWAKPSVAGGGRVAHRFSKGPAPPPLPVFEEADDQDLPQNRLSILVGQAALEQTLKEGIPIWTSAEREGEQHPLDWTVEDSLEPISAEQVLEAAVSFSPTTALGWDAFSPRLLLQLPRPLVEAFCGHPHCLGKESEGGSDAASADRFSRQAFGRSPTDRAASPLCEGLEQN